MDRETRRELDRLLGAFDEALFDVRAAADDEHVVGAWRRVQMAGHELNALLPPASVTAARRVASGR